MLPEIRSSSEVYGMAVGDLAGVPVAGILGDQQASLFGHTCFDHGDMKNTYGTGAFLLFTLGNEPVMSEHGLVTTVAWKLGDADPVYALEGSVAIAGALVQWLRDNLGIIDDASEIESLARSVDGSEGVVFVPAFSGLFAPYWRDDARGVIVGLTRFSTKGHIARAALEATAYQTYDLAQAMLADTGLAQLGELRVDGGMTQNDLLMQFQADILGSPVAAPAIAEIPPPAPHTRRDWRPNSGQISTSCARTTRSHAAGSLGWATTSALAASPPGTTVSSGPSAWRKAAGRTRE